MLRKYIENKMYVGMLFAECPLNQDSILKIRDRYYAETPRGLYIFIGEAALKRRGISLDAVSDGDDAVEVSKSHGVLCPA